MLKVSTRVSLLKEFRGNTLAKGLNIVGEEMKVTKINRDGKGKKVK